METLTLSSHALEQLGQMLRDAPIAQCPILFVEVLNQKPGIVLKDDSNNQPEGQTCSS
jgi:hypothetical protein